MTSLAAQPRVRFDPTKDKTYRAATLGKQRDRERREQERRT